jgi:RimJ/RimL family protein N-acetyltransferase
MHGRLSRLEPLAAARHAEALFEANALDAEGRNWTYLPYGPWDRLEEYVAWVAERETSEDPLWFAIIDLATERPVGVATYLRLDPPNGVIEVGHLAFSPLLQRRPVATEAMYLMARRAFDELGYRRYEWKCHALNAPSRAAAERLGFTYEGTFRQATVVKGRNRDTAWLSITDAEWPPIRAALEAWLAPSNFDANGRQLRRLADFMDAVGPGGT